jgi:hypothetical protein
MFDFESGHPVCATEEISLRPFEVCIIINNILITTNNRHTLVLFRKRMREVTYSVRIITTRNS